MKSETVNTEKEQSFPAQPVGDAIGDTAYSERFVLKILLKLANLDILKDEVKEKSFEDDMCTLWDMTAEKDVVMFLRKHNVLNLFSFALPVVEAPRIIEVIIGIIGNLCCYYELVSDLLQMENFLIFIINYIKSDDSLTIVQVLRLVNSGLYLAKENDLNIWMKLFMRNDYSSALYFILKNSSHKNLLLTALENFNIICSYCTEKCRAPFQSHFANENALEAIVDAFNEMVNKHKASCEKEELERIFVISLQLILNLIKYDESKETYKNYKSAILDILEKVLKYFKVKIVDEKEIDTDLSDVIDFTSQIVDILDLSEISELEKFFIPTFEMWQTLRTAKNDNKNGSSFEEGDESLLENFIEEIYTPLSTLLFLYMNKCSEENIMKSLYIIDSNCDDVKNAVKDRTLLESVSKRIEIHRTRI